MVEGFTDARKTRRRGRLTRCGLGLRLQTGNRGQRRQVERFAAPTGRILEDRRTIGRFAAVDLVLGMDRGHGEGHGGDGGGQARHDGSCMARRDARCIPGRDARRG